MLGTANAAALILGGCLTIVGYRSCGHYGTFPFATVMMAAFARIVAMINIGIAQEASAKTILQSQEVSVDAAIYQERRVIDSDTLSFIYFPKIMEKIVYLLNFSNSRIDTSIGCR